MKCLSLWILNKDLGRNYGENTPMAQLTFAFETERVKTRHFKFCLNMQFYVALLIVATAVPLSTQQRRERRGKKVIKVKLLAALLGNESNHSNRV